MAVEQALACVGIYPASIKSPDTKVAYEERDDYKNGWNAGSMKVSEMAYMALEKLAPEDDQDMDLLIAADVGWMRDDGGFYLDMNDTFHWASSDSERVPDDATSTVAQLFRSYGRLGLMYWVAEQRGYDPSLVEDYTEGIKYVRKQEKKRLTR